MPTAARLIAAISLALTALAISYAVAVHFPESQKIGWLYEISGALGALVGWISVGRRAGRGVLAAFYNGLTGGFLLLFWALLVFGFLRMWHLAFRFKYDEPFQALQGWLEESLAYAALLKDPTVLVLAVMGALLTGILAELAAKHFR